MKTRRLLLKTKQAFKAIVLLLMIGATGVLHAQNDPNYDFSQAYSVEVDGTTYQYTLYFSYNYNEGEENTVYIVAPYSFDMDEVGWGDNPPVVKDLVLPSSVNYGGNSYPVTGIASYAFRGITTITGKLTIPNTIHWIGEEGLRAYVFGGCTGITSIEFESNSQLKYIGYSAFDGCSNLQSINHIPNSVREIERYAFSDCSSLEAIDFEEPSQLERIGDGAFSGCSSITEISIPSSVTTLDGNVFENCSSLATIDIPDDLLVSISDVLGTQWYANQADGVLYLGNCAIGYKGTPSGVLTIGGTVNGKQIKNIGNNAFSAAMGYIEDNGNGFTGIEITAPVEVIGSGAFNGSSGIRGDLTIAETVVKILGNAFHGCSGLEGSLTIPESVKLIDMLAFAECNFNTINYNVTYDEPFEIGLIPMLEAYPFYNCATNHLVIGDNVKNIPPYMFANTAFACALELPESVKTIAPYAFSGSTGLSGSLDLSNVTTLSEGAFQNCSGLNGTLTLPSIKTIPQYAFYNCGFTNPLVFPNTVTTIETYAFSGCKFSSITLPTSINYIKESAFEGCSYMASNGSLTIPTSTIAIERNAFKGCTMGSINLPNDNKLEHLHRDAFAETGWYNAQTNNDLLILGNWCLGYKGTHPSTLTITALSGVKHIADHAFEAGMNVRITTLTLSDNITTIGDYAFSRNNILTSLTLPTGLKRIGKNAFSGCTLLSGNLTIPTNVEEIDDYAFYYCSGLNGNLVFGTPNNLIRIGESAFEECSGFTGNLTIPDHVQWIEDRAFKNCSSFSTDLVIGSAVKEIGNEAFYGCTSLSNITIPASVTYIGYNAFGNTGWYNAETNNTTIGIFYLDDWCVACTGLPPAAALSKTLTIRDGCVGIVGGVFEGRSGIEKLVLPESLKAIGEKAFYNCSNLEDIGDLSHIEDLGVDAFTNTYWALNYTGVTPLDQNSNVLYKDGVCIGKKRQGMLLKSTSDNDNAIVIRSDTRVIARKAFEGGVLSLLEKGQNASSNSETYTTIPNSVEHINAYAFANSSGFKDLVLPSSLKTIGEGAFTGCRDIEDVVIPSSVEEIGAYAFKDCNLRKIFIVQDDPISPGLGAFDGVQKNIPFYTPINRHIHYTTDKEWSKFTNYQRACFFVGSDSNDYEWNSTTNWAFGNKASESPGPYGGLDRAVILSYCHITANQTINDLYIAQGKMLSVRNSSSKDDASSVILTVDGTIENRGTAGSFWLNAGTQLLNYTEGVQATIEIEYALSGGNPGDTPVWQFVATPFVNECFSSGGRVALATEPHDERYRFNQAAELEWENEDNYHFGYENGVGYLYATNQYIGRYFSGELRQTYDKVFGIETRYAYFDLAYVPGNPFTGWNLVGNPFPCDAYINKSYYVINNEGNGIIETPVSDLSSPIASCTGVFVVAEEEGQQVTFTRIADGSANSPHGYLSVSLLSGTATTRSVETIDHATVSFNAGDELLKLNFLTGDAKIYIPRDDKQYAIAVTEQQGELPLNFEAYKDGTYTINITPDRAELSYLHLIDNLTGADVDLLQTSSYSFKASTKDYASRFKLVFDANDSENGASTESETFAYYNGSEWVINNPSTGSEAATLQVIDEMGRVLSNETVNGNTSVSLNQTPGVYVLRLINCDSIKTQKIVIR